LASVEEKQVRQLKGVTRKKWGRLVLLNLLHHVIIHRLSLRTPIENRQIKSELEKFVVSFFVGRVREGFQLRKWDEGALKIG